MFNIVSAHIVVQSTNLSSIVILVIILLFTAISNLW
uniref:Uncharacterized protein n=1 Tax=virus sp. ctBM815 TaxID=2825806 RepID=A0A8S5RJB5_9VIRU|nr:MAG TPA: hypothetical protein [virus sp. ctBM815]